MPGGWTLHALLAVVRRLFDECDFVADVVEGDFIDEGSDKHEAVIDADAEVGCMSIEAGDVACV